MMALICHSMVCCFCSFKVIYSCPKWKQPEEHVSTVTHLRLLTIPIYPLIPVGIIAVNKDLGPNVCANQENTKPGTETQIKITWLHVKEGNSCAINV